MKLLERLVAERFMAHRRRSTSIAGMACAALALGLFEYRLIVHHVADWDLFLVGAAFVAIKLSLMAWYFLTE